MAQDILELNIMVLRVLLLIKMEKWRKFKYIFFGLLYNVVIFGGYKFFDFLILVTFFNGKNYTIIYIFLTKLINMLKATFTHPIIFYFSPREGIRTYDK